VLFRSEPAVSYAQEEASMDVVVMGAGPGERDEIVMALRAAGYAARPGDRGIELTADVALVAALGHDGDALARAAAADVPAIGLPDRWSSAARVRAASALAAAGLGPHDQLGSAPPLVVEDLVIEEDAHAAYREGVPLDLTHREFLLLVMLARHPNRVLNRQLLMDRLWGDEVVTPNTIEVHISSLRRKMEAHGSRMIFTVRRVGYVLRSEKVVPWRDSLLQRAPAADLRPVIDLVGSPSPDSEPVISASQPAGVGPPPR